MRKREDPHTSSGSVTLFNAKQPSFKPESEVSTYNAKEITISVKDPYPPTSMKVLRGVKNENQYSSSVYVKISNILREERNYLINQKISGKREESVSTKDD